MADVLLFGPHLAGKTQLYYSLRGKEYLSPIQTDEEDYKAKNSGVLGALGLSHYSIHEIGGKDVYNQDIEFLEKAFITSGILVFVFNGNKLIEELKHYREGGDISSMLRCIVSPALENCNKQKDIRFIATYEDEYAGQKADMGSEIISCIEHANEEYRKVANSTRYPFKPLMPGNLFCVDARDSKKVKDLFKNIIIE